MPGLKKRLCLLLAGQKPADRGEAAEVSEGARWARWSLIRAQAHWSLPAGRLARVQRERRREPGFLEVPGAVWGFAGRSCPSGAQPQPFPARSRRLAGLREFLTLAVAAEPCLIPYVRGLILALAAGAGSAPCAPPPSPRSPSRGRGSERQARAAG